MDPKETNEGDDRLDQATARRLSRLRTMPVDTGRLEQMMRAQIGEPDAAPRRGFSSFWELRQVRAVAASIGVLLVIAAALISTSGGPVMASATQMAQVHRDLVSGKVKAIEVSSISEANEALASVPGSPQLPDVPAEHVMMCCMKSVKDKKLACVLLRSEGVPVTMAVANAMDMKLPSSETITRGGVKYFVQSSGSLNMVMSERNGRWVCLIGELSRERLMDLATQLSF